MPGYEKEPNEVSSCAVIMMLILAIASLFVIF
jgi:hypothetical protein